MEHMVAQLVEALCYKLEGRRFDSRWCHSKFSLSQSFQPHNGPGVESASDRRVPGISPGGAGGGRRADNLTTFMCRLSWNLGASSSWNPQGLSRTVMGLLYHLQKWMCHGYHDTIFKNSRQKESEGCMPHIGEHANNKMWSKSVPGWHCGGFGTGDIWCGSNA